MPRAQAPGTEALTARGGQGCPGLPRARTAAESDGCRSDKAVSDGDTTCKAQGCRQRGPSIPTVPPVAPCGQKAVGGAGAQELIPSRWAAGLRLVLACQMPRRYLTLALGSPAARLWVRGTRCRELQVERGSGKVCVSGCGPAPRSRARAPGLHGDTGACSWGPGHSACPSHGVPVTRRLHPTCSPAPAPHPCPTNGQQAPERRASPSRSDLTSLGPSGWGEREMETKCVFIYAFNLNSGTDPTW